MECPNCKLINPADAVRCDCGFHLADSTSADKTRAVKQLRWLMGVIGCLLAAVALYAFVQTLPTDLDDIYRSTILNQTGCGKMYRIQGTVVNIGHSYEVDPSYEVADGSGTALVYVSSASKNRGLPPPRIGEPVKVLVKVQCGGVRVFWEMSR